MSFDEQLSEGQALLKQGRLAEALTLFREAAALKPDSFKFNLHLAGVCLRTGPLDLALNTVPSLFHGGLPYPQVLEIMNLAFNAARIALTLRPRSPEARLAYGLVLLLGDRWKEAEDIFRPLAEEKPELAVHHFRLAQVVARQGRLKEAADLMRTALQLEPRNDDFNFELADILRKGGRTEEARALLNTALAAGAGRRCAEGLGLLELTQCRWPEAEKIFRDLVRDYPEKPQYMCALAKALAWQQNFTESQILAREGLALLYRQTYPGRCGPSAVD